MKRKRNSIRVVILLGILPFLNGCAAVGLTLFGVGAGVATGTSVGYTLDGYAYRTFTAPLPQVESATRTALNRMGIKIEATAKTEQGKAIAASRDSGYQKFRRKESFLPGHFHGRGVARLFSQDRSS